MKRLRDALERLDRAMDVARDPHTLRCQTAEWDTCTCGYREATEQARAALDAARGPDWQSVLYEVERAAVGDVA